MAANFAEVKVLMPGYFKWLGINKCKASSTVSLIQDEGKNIIFDTGTSNNKKEIIKALKSENLTPADIDYVILSHNHTDHLENLCLFNKATSLNSYEIKKGDNYQLSTKLFITGQKKLTKHVKILATPGHTAECISVLVETKDGVIAITGDLFVKKQEEKGLLIQSREKFNKSRKKIIKIADYIIPGHGKMFKVIK